MRIYITVTSIVLLVSFTAATNKENEAEFMRTLKQAIGVCNSNPATQVKPEVFKNLNKGGPIPEDLKELNLCLTKFFGWQNSEGALDEDAIKAKAVAINGKDTPELQDKLRECTQNQADAGETAAHFWKCAYELSLFGSTNFQ